MVSHFFDILFNCTGKSITKITNIPWFRKFHNPCLWHKKVNKCITICYWKKNSKITSVANFIPRKFWSLSQGTSKVLCSHCPINDSSDCFTLSFILQLCHKPLDILQMETKSQKVHISKDDELPNFAISTLLKIGSGFPRVAGIRPSPKKYLIC